MDDVKNRVCDLGILYLSHENEVVMRKVIEENHLVFIELFSAKPHVFLQKDHPLASKKVVSVHDLAENETMHIGYVLNENQELSELGKSYLEELRKYAPANP